MNRKGRPRHSLRSLCLPMILADIPPQAIAAEIGAHRTSVTGWIRDLGFLLMYVTAEERAHLVARRQANLLPVARRDDRRK